jgi:tRNA nucleotidyltransferase (CCA-adding enzyme)
VEHGTVGVLSDEGVLYEVTTFRRDVETDGRHAVVSFADTVKEDLARRDFTINALAWHPLRKVMLDPFQGERDLGRRVLRAVGVAADRFAEDHLRILRALRFAGRFGLTVEEETWVALSAGVPHLRSLSAERIRDELLKVLDADRSPGTALTLYRDSGALSVLYPELAGLAVAAPALWRGALGAADHVPRGRPLLRLAALMRALPPAEAVPLLTRLRLSHAQTDEVARRAAAPPMPSLSAPEAEVRRWLGRVGPSRLGAVARLELAWARATGSREDRVERTAAWRRARAVRAERPPLELADLAFDGRALIRLGCRPGPHFGPLLDGLLDWVMEDPARNQEGLLAAEALRRIGGAGDHG